MIANTEENRRRYLTRAQLACEKQADLRLGNWLSSDEVPRLFDQIDNLRGCFRTGPGPNGRRGVDLMTIQQLAWQVEEAERGLAEYRKRAGLPDEPAPKVYRRRR